MRLIPCTIVLALAASCPLIAQHWEIGALGGYGWYRNSTISNPTIANPQDSGTVGFPSRATLGVVFGETPYHHLGGEVRWLYQWGGPQIESNGIKTSMTGYSNLVTYDFVIYPVRSESGLRPYFAGGAGAKIYTGTGFRYLGQGVTADLGLLRPVTQVEPAISVGGGVKYLLAKHVQCRLDFRAYLTPTPNEVIRPTGFSAIHGWLSTLVPTAGLSYVF
jgi:hypothetical protein